MAASTMNNTLKIHDVTRITPFSDSTTEFALPLTLFDTYWLKFPPVERLFFYQIDCLTHDLFNSAIIPKLKHSLSLTLLHYLPLAGNLMCPQGAAEPALCYFPDDAVSFTVAESNADFNHLSGNGIREAADYRPLTPQLSISDDKAEPLAIQITLFPNQGFCIGIATHHAVFDGKSLVMFVKSWAYLSKEDREENPSLPPELSPFLGRTVIKDPKGIAMVYVKNWLAVTGSDLGRVNFKVLPNFTDVNKLARGTFVLTREDIRKLRDKVLSLIDKVNEDEVNESEKLHLSTFVLTCAYAFTCIIKAKGGEATKDVIFAFTADYRNRLDPPLPTNYFGNCVGSHIRTAKASDFMDETGVAFVALKLSDMVKELENGLTLDGFEEKLVKLISIFKPIAEGAHGLGIAGSTRFDVYGSDFGWGRPRKVEIVSIDATGAVALAGSRDGGGGVEVGVVLGKQEMKNFASLFEEGLH